MKRLLSRIDRLRLAALLFWALPVVALLPLGAFWLWQAEALRWWLLSMVACSAAGYGLQAWLRRRDRRSLAEAATGPDPRWPPKAESAWTEVERLAETVRPEDWPLDDGGRLWSLGQTALETVARHHHPHAERPLLELTVPHALLIVERASRDLRATIAGQIPFSHRLTVGDLLRVWRWKAFAERVSNVYRAGRLVINPANALLSEIWGQLRDRGYGVAWTELHRWLLREYVRKVGYYAIDLYSGRLTLSDTEPTAEPTETSQADMRQTEVAADRPGEPLRILVLGRTGAGKSSLINALFGHLVAATDTLPDTTATLTPHRLQRDGLDAALIVDAPGCDSPLLDEKALERAALAADLVLWVCAAHRPDRQLDRERLDALRNRYAARPERRPPPVLVALTHIDHLRPSREWQPPYDLSNPATAKAANIRAAALAGAAGQAGAAAPGGAGWRARGGPPAPPRRPGGAGGDGGAGLPGRGAHLQRRRSLGGHSRSAGRREPGSLSALSGRPQTAGKLGPARPTARRRRALAGRFIGTAAGLSPRRPHSAPSAPRESLPCYNSASEQSRCRCDSTLD